jgi:DNA-binding CsgD family transcriptional regulator
MTDRSLLSYNANFLKQIQELCKPLETYLGINHFGYLKVYKNLQYFYVSNDLGVTSDYLLNVKDSNIFYKNYLSESNNLDTKYILWPDQAENYSMELYLKHGFWNGLTALKLNENDVEMWWFATDPNNVLIQNFYKDHLDILQRYIHYFNKKLKQFAKVDHTNLAVYTKGFDFNIPLVNDNAYPDASQVSAFVNHLFPRGVATYSTNGIIQLTNSEIKCLRLIAECYSAKEVAQKLNISERTVESHLARIRYKSGYNLKSDIVNLLYKQVEDLALRIGLETHGAKEKIWLR